MTIMAEVNCSHRIAHGPLPLLSSSSFGPHSSSRRAASSSLSPDSAPVSRARSTSSASDVCHAHSSPRRSLPIREPPSRALPACLPKVGPGYGASVFPDSLALRLYACWGGSRHSSVTSGSAFTVSYRRVRSPGYRTSRFRSRGVHRPPARSCLRGATPPWRRSRSGHAPARTSLRHPGRWNRPPPPLPSAKLSSGAFRLRMVMMPAGYFVLWDLHLGVEEISERAEIRFVHRDLLQGPLAVPPGCRLGRLEPQAAGRDDDAGVHADALVEYVSLTDHAAGARGSINRLGVYPSRSVLLRARIFVGPNGRSRGARYAVLVGD